MSANNKELAVAALRNGTVIDHIPSAAVFKAAKILGLEDAVTAVTIGANLDSRKLGKKGIIKVADMFFPEEIINRIAIIAPTAVVNIIKDFEVVEKRPVKLPDELIGIVRCNNPKCITNNEPMASRFNVVDEDQEKLRCHYCGKVVSRDEATII